MRVIAFKEACPGRRTRRGRHMTLFEMDAFSDQSVQVWRVHVVVTQRRNRVITLLVGDDKDNVRLSGHG